MKEFSLCNISISSASVYKPFPPDFFLSPPWEMLFARDTSTVYHWDQRKVSSHCLIWSLSSIWLCWLGPFSELCLSMALWESLFPCGLPLMNWMILVLQTSVLLSPLLTTGTVISSTQLSPIYQWLQTPARTLSPILASLSHLTRQVLLLCTWQLGMCWHKVTQRIPWDGSLGHNSTTISAG